jgi:hypothetical protein
VYKFSPSAIPQNLRYMPAHLIEAMLMLVVGLAALVWIIVQAVRQRSAVADLAAGVAPDAATRRDLAVGLALAASWAAVWVLYAAYTWTAFPGLSTLASVRFYVPAMAAIALLGAWLITRLPRRESLAAASCAVLVVPMLSLGLWSFDYTLQRVHQLLPRPAQVRVGPAPVRDGPAGPAGPGGPSPAASAVEAP